MSARRSRNTSFGSPCGGMRMSRYNAQTPAVSIGLYGKPPRIAPMDAFGTTGPLGEVYEFCFSYAAAHSSNAAMNCVAFTIAFGESLARERNGVYTARP